MYHPKYLVHGHVHLSYGQDPTREREYGETAIINTTEHYVLEIPKGEFPERQRDQLIWKTKHRDFYKEN